MQRDVDHLKDQIEDMTDAIRKLTNAKMVDKGLTSEDCQRMHLLNQLSAFEHAVNGISEDDLIKQPTAAKSRSLSM